MIPFSDILGQNELKAGLIKQANSGSLHHAHLFLGKMGHGNFQLALAFVKYIYCQEKLENDSCGACANCIKIDKFNHPDIHWTFPSFDAKSLSPSLMKEFKAIVEETKGLFDLKDWQDFNNEKNSKIRSTECDIILNNMGMHSYENGYKTQVIWMMESLEKEANKILKILEEPNPNTIFILIAERSEFILPTILSRCNLVKVPALKAEEMKIFISDQNSIISEDELQRTAIFSDGDLIEAKRYMEDSESDFPMESVLLDFLKGFIDFNQRKFSVIIKSLKTSEDIVSQSKNTQRKFLDFFQYFLRQLLILKYTNTCQLHDNLLKAAHYFADKLEIDQIELWSQIIDDTYRSIEGNANVKISFVSLAIRSGKIQNRQEFEEYIN